MSEILVRPNPGTRRRDLLKRFGAALAFGTTGTICAGLSGGCTQLQAGPPPTVESADRQRLRLIAYAVIPPLYLYRDTPVGGISAIDFDARSGEYLLLSDDRSDRAPARFYAARWNWPTRPELTDRTSLKGADGNPWPSRQHALRTVPVPDPEALRFRSATDTVLWSTEGDVSRGFGPALYETRRDGSLVRQFELPAMFDAADGHSRGPRDNLGFEGLALTPDGRYAWLSMEAALCQDGPVAAATGPVGPCRLTQIDLDTGHAVRQIAYVPDNLPLQPNPANGFADNGISEILMIDSHRMLLLERAYAQNVGNSLRLYEVDTLLATDTLAQDTLRPGSYSAVKKRLVADFSTLGLPRLDNTEGMCWGPPQPDGHRTLVVVSDDNFNPGQITQLAAFEYTE